MFLFVERLLAKIVTNRLIVISKQQSIEIGEKFGVGRPSQIKVIPLGLDLDIFSGYAKRRSRFRHELYVPDDAILVGIVGRLTEIKNHQMFLNVVARFKEIDPPAGDRARYVSSLLAMVCCARVWNIKASR